MSEHHKTALVIQEEAPRAQNPFPSHQTVSNSNTWRDAKHNNK